MVSTRPDYTVPFFLNGEEYRTAERFEIKSPVTGERLHSCSSAGSQDVSKAIESSAAAFKTWRRMTPSRRRDIFLKAADVMERRIDELAQNMSDETGCSAMWSGFNLNTTINTIRDVAGRISSIEGSMPSTTDEKVGALIYKEPYGVVLAVAPWNAPYILATRAVVFPLAAGNTVILKASEMSPRTIWGVVSCFHEAGIPAGVLNMIVHAPVNAHAVTSQLVADPNIRKINFTGSTHVGRIIAKLAGEHLKPVLLELGGKAPAIVWHDAKLEEAADACAMGAFLNSGQICMSTERILVHKDIREDFEAKLAASIEKLFPSAGDALTLITAVGVDKNKGLVRDAVTKGASLLVGNPDDASKTSMRPIVVKGVTPQMDIYQTESFGPTVSLIEIDSEEEAIRIANDCDYGLTSAVFTEDLRLGLRMARAIETGAVHINGMTVHDEPALPHGGTKMSGYGRFNTAAGLDEWLKPKSVTFKY